jgi:hypothetical protein
VTLTALVVVVLAVTAALVYNRVVWRPRQASGRTSDDGLSIAAIIGPLATLAVLLLVFVLVQTYASWSAAGDAETAEATATLLLFREADLVKEPRPGIACAPRSSATRQASSARSGRPCKRGA